MIEILVWLFIWSQSIINQFILYIVVWDLNLNFSILMPEFLAGIKSHLIESL
jgi:hypothetical protein